jgi:hypothetical protein
MNDAQQRPIFTPNTIPVQPPAALYTNVVKVPTVVEKPARWPLYFFIGSVILAILAAIPFVVPGVGATLRSYVASMSGAKAPTQQAPQIAQQESSITQQQARSAALKAIIEAEGPQKIRSRTEIFSIVDARTITTEYGWIFFWNTKKFIETGDIRTSVPGTGPVVVTNKGDVEFLPTNIPPVEAIAAYEYRIGARVIVLRPATTTPQSESTTTPQTASTTLQSATTTVSR